jgi:hypothetical protein
MTLVLGFIEEPDVVDVEQSDGHRVEKLIEQRAQH